VTCYACRFSQPVRQLQIQSSEQNTAGSPETHMSDITSPLLESVSELDDVQVHISIKQKKPSLLRALLPVVGPKLLQGHLCKLVADVLIFCGPLLQRYCTAVLMLFFGI